MRASGKFWGHFCVRRKAINFYNPEAIVYKEIFQSGPSYLPYHVATCDYSINLNLTSVLIVFWQNVTIL